MGRSRPEVLGWWWSSCESTAASYLDEHQPSYGLEDESGAHGQDVNTRIVPDVWVEPHAVACLRSRFIHQD